MSISPIGLPIDTPMPSGGGRAQPAARAARAVNAAASIPIAGTSATRTVEVALPDLMPGHLQLDIDRDTGQVIGRIVDKKTGALISQVPSAEALRLAASVKQDIGRIFHRKV